MPETKKDSAITSQTGSSQTNVWTETVKRTNWPLQTNVDVWPLRSLGADCWNTVGIRSSFSRPCPWRSRHLRRRTRSSPWPLLHNHPSCRLSRVRSSKPCLLRQSLDKAISSLSGYTSSGIVVVPAVVVASSQGASQVRCADNSSRYTYTAQGGSHRTLMQYPPCPFLIR